MEVKEIILSGMVLVLFIIIARVAISFSNDINQAGKPKK